MADEKLPMDGLDQPADLPNNDQGGAPPADDQPQDRARDESGRFAPRQEPGPRGQPDREAARRREAAERDDARREASDWKSKHDALTKRLDDMAALAKGDAQDEQPDPLAALSGKVDQIAGSIQQQQEARERTEAWQGVTAYADQDQARFTQQNADFPHAVEHYIVSRLHEMKALGLSEQDAEGALQREAQELLIASAQRGSSPSEAIYAMAQARGYNPGAPMRTVPQQSQPPQSRPAGGRSFGTASGPAGGGLTAQQIANMDDADYMAFRNTPEGKRAIRRSMGG